jgi:CheY-like chemotaxis protein
MAIVLVVNDDHDMLDAYRALLTELGHEVVTEIIVESGPRAVRDAQADAILVDLQQPHQDDYGLRLIEDVRADPAVKAIPIILSTAAVEEVHAMRPVLDRLQVAVLRKPFRMTELETVLAEALSGPDPS